MADEKPIWQRVDSDTDKSFEAFCQYRDLGAGRSLEKVAQKYAKSIPVLKRWSAGHNWVERCAVYDTWVDDEHSRERIKRQKRVETNAWKDYEAIRKGIEKRIALYEQDNWQGDISELREVLRLMREADDLARRSVGLADRISETKADVTSNGKEISTADSMAAALVIAQQQLKDWNPDGSGKD